MCRKYNGVVVAQDMLRFMDVNCCLESRAGQCAVHVQRFDMITLLPSDSGSTISVTDPSLMNTHMCRRVVESELQVHVMVA